DRHLRRRPHLGEKLADDLAKLFLRNLLFDVLVGAVEIRRIRAKAIRAEQRADENHARLRKRRIGFDLFRDFDAELPFELDVDDDELRARLAHELERWIAGLEVFDGEAEAAEMLAEKLAE